jgi:hypothetical protein
MYTNAILPNGIHSISIELDVRNKTDMIKRLEEALTHEVRKILSDPFSSFNFLFKSVVRDYVNYGNALMRLNTKTDRAGMKSFECIHVPFRNVYFYSRYMHKEIYVAYKITYTKEELMLAYPSFYTGKEIDEHITLTYLFVPKEAKSKEYPDGYVISEYVIDEGKGKVIETISHDPEQIPLFIAREVKTNQFYGFGTGLGVIAAVIDMNATAAQKSELKLQMIEPPKIIEEGATIQTVEEYFGGGKQDFQIRAGATYVIKSGISGGTAPTLQFLNKEIGANFSLLSADYGSLKEELKEAYHMDIFTEFRGPTKTATEIMERINVAIETFSGKSAPFYNELLHPLLRYVTLAIFDEVKSSLQSAGATRISEQDLKSFIRPVVFTYADQKRLEKDAMKLDKLHATYAGMPPEQITEEDWQELKAQAQKLYKEV